MIHERNNDQRSIHLILSSRFRGIYRHFSENIWLSLSICYKNAASRSSVRLLFLTVCLFIGMFVSTRLLDFTLSPWRETGITEESIERAKGLADFRLVILNGTAYVEHYKKSVQSRDVFTIWGLLQLLRRYPGKVSDLDLMFECFDFPLVGKKYYDQLNSTVVPPPLFRYCGDDDSLDIVFPDWSFWGWAEINIKPWDLLLKDLSNGNKRIEWIDREPYAYWKGNPWVAEHRKDLLTCNVSNTQDWNARLYIQDWDRESQQGFMQSNLADQCTHRYKIYIEGSAWSVSEKYILACDSVTLMVTPRYYDFFTRGLMPGRHYWPVRMDDKCRSIKFASEWGDNHEQQAKAMGKAASSFIQEDLKMDNVYDYMFHLLTGYSKLMKYKPTVPQNAVELCSEAMACGSEGFAKQFMEESTVNGPTDVSPCIMQPPYDPRTLNSILDTKVKSIKQVEKWEKDYFEQINQE
ncbi:hypothetical protein L1987_43086 [Smallanthus sonchifolius]|uniref:Uncharacterized protein n=1 Tax=Smallanthus sonchifolius TaxID=185202 RepID=A0ACB9GLU6_9ASTR|nr:hypothetical protein L1987_43086 [Smallanthus sonchifolius]